MATFFNKILKEKTSAFLRALHKPYKFWDGWYTFKQKLIQIQECQGVRLLEGVRLLGSQEYLVFHRKTKESLGTVPDKLRIHFP